MRKTSSRIVFFTNGFCSIFVAQSWTQLNKTTAPWALIKIRHALGFICVLSVTAAFLPLDGHWYYIRAFSLKKKENCSKKEKSWMLLKLEAFISAWCYLQKCIFQQDNNTTFSPHTKVFCSMQNTLRNILFKERETENANWLLALSFSLFPLL